MSEIENKNSLSAKVRDSAVKSLGNKSIDASEAAKPFLDKEMVMALIDVASQSKFDDSPLVMKQKIRKVIKARIRKEA
jgi:hypothetical protein